MSWSPSRPGFRDRPSGPGLGGAQLTSVGLGKHYKRFRSSRDDRSYAITTRVYLGLAVSPSRSVSYRRTIDGTVKSGPFVRRPTASRRAVDVPAPDARSATIAL